MLHLYIVYKKLKAYKLAQRTVDIAADNLILFNVVTYKSTNQTDWFQYWL